MIQAIIRNGKVVPEEVAAPKVEDGQVLIQVSYSAISSGTEVSSVKGSNVNILQKALNEPEKVVKYLNKIKSVGYGKVLQEVKQVQQFGSATGYSLAGEIIAIGKGITRFAVGEKVAAAGGGFAYHAEFVSIPDNLVVKIDQKANMADCSTVAIGGIALHGVRRASLHLGETAVVYGVGLIGLLTVQLLRLSGVKVIAIDIDDKRLSLASKAGADYVLNVKSDEPVSFVNNLTGGRGCDAVLFTAATSSSDPLAKAFQMTRRKGKVILVGVSGMEIKREDIYSKEIDFLVSTSYGPGRYDKDYEEKGVDYPYAYVRWTENRNMEEYCRLVSNKKLDLSIFNYGVFNIKEVEKAYDLLDNGSPKPMLLILDYENTLTKSPTVFKTGSSIKNSSINVAVIGTGAFAMSTHLPNLKKMSDKYNIYSIMSRSGHNAKNAAEMFGAAYHTSDYEYILNDKNVDLVMICNRHGLHFDYVYQALTAGKNVFVEKPLCTTLGQLQELQKYFDADYTVKPLLTVGYNRRFSPYAESIKEQVSKRINPLMIHYRMNAGYSPAESWIHEDGGRIVGEACHIVDLMNFFTESQISSISYDSINPRTEKYFSHDNKSIILRYTDGSICNIQYFSIGNPTLPKEYMEVHFDGKSIIMDDYKSLKYFGLINKDFVTKKIEKGHAKELEVLAKSINDGSSPIELWDLFQTSFITLSID
jgi:predicted dehydrogenase/threonine dehydrogenase-like Zn-dependent dehydrogenase